MAQPSGNPPGQAHAARTTHARTHARAVPFASDATRTRNVSEYMLVLALCLVCLFVSNFAQKRPNGFA